MIITSDAIILRAVRYGDTSKIVTALTREHGRVAVIAKGALGSKPRFGAALEPMAHSTLVYYFKESRDVQMLSQADVIEPFRRLQSDGRRLVLGFAVIEYAYLALHAGEHHPELYSLLLRTLRGIDTSEGQPGNMLLRYLVDFSDEMGFSLDMDHCARCRIDLTDERATSGPMSLALADGAFLCTPCARSVMGVELAPRLFKALRWLKSCEPERLEALSLTPVDLQAALRILHQYIASHIQEMRAIRSLELLDALT